MTIVKLLLLSRGGKKEVEKHLNKTGLKVDLKHVKTNGELKHYMQEFEPDIILADRKARGRKELSQILSAQPETSLILLADNNWEPGGDEYPGIHISDLLLKDQLWRLPASIKRVIYLREKHNKAQDEADERYLTYNRYRLLAENSSDMITSTAYDGIFNYVSSACGKILGYKPEEMIGTQCYAYLHPDDIPKIEEVHLKMLDTRINGFIQYRLRRKDGSYAWVETTAHPIISQASGEVLEMVSITRDITQRVKNERKLATVDKLLKEAQQLANMGSWSMSLSSREVYWSDTMRKLLMIPEHIEPGYDAFVAMIYPVDKQKFIDKVDEAIQLGKRYENDYRIVRGDGEIRNIYSVANFEHDAKGKPVRFFGICHDVTERKKSANKLKRVEKFLSEAQHLAKMGNWNLDLTNNTLFWSDSLRKLFAVSDDFVPTTDSFIAMIHPDDAAEAKVTIENAMKTGVGYEHKFKIVRGDGVVRLLHAVTTFEVGEDGNPSRMYGSCQDITQQHEYEMKLLKAEQRMLEAQHMANFGNWYYDVNTQEVYWSSGIRKVYGISEEFPVNYEFFLNAVHPGDKKEVFAMVQEVQTNGEQFDHTFRIIRPNGEVRFVHEIMRGEFNEGGELMRLYGTSQDVTELKNAQRVMEKTLDEMEQTVEYRTSQLSHSNRRLKEEIEERTKLGQVIQKKNKSITESIQYAERLQKAVLPSPQTIRSAFRESFIFNRPKDIVSGDFYWMHKVRQKTMIVCADCTGHGVPGAFMSLLGAEALERIVVDQEWRYPSLVLELLDAELEATLLTEGEVVTDGMDMTYCKIDSIEKKILFAGAMNPIMLAGKSGIRVIKGSRFSLGGYLNTAEKKFDTHQISYQDGDMLYMFSDGFQDQFGGPKGKKFMFKSLVKILDNIHRLPAKEQEVIVTHHFEEWKEKTEQTDDVLLMGVRL